MKDQLKQILFEETNLTEYKLKHMSDESLTEASNRALDKIIANVSNKYNRVDLKLIHDSKGDVTRFVHYKTMMECLDVLKSIANATINIPQISVIVETIAILEKYRREFQLAYVRKNSGVIMVYSTTLMGAYMATSELVSNSLQFINGQFDSPDQMSANVNEEGVQSDLFSVDALVQFNKSDRDGTLKKLLDNTDKPMEEAALMEFTVTPVAASVFIGFNVLFNFGKIMRGIIYTYYNSRTKLADYFSVQEALLKSNIELLKSGDGNVKIVARQEKWAKRFNKLATKLAIDKDKAQSQTAKEIRQEPVDMDEVII